MILGDYNYDIYFFLEIGLGTSLRSTKYQMSQNLALKSWLPGLS
jgi:hypothetical protein